ncbi:hypothetical protein [Allorhodopirellula solitaria]|uniref:DUF922 domain-containing protein n=1 Tax=Allorhodopirellula solitaria TaxID=2527987 RepID=A0A5C5YJY0_9BACT|nr:hypothetical protein [Allorhodopirellula solitaria]TWT75206.1 hypothetical protein CA85_04950 [Allorhodopirellula solitaria]
MFCFARLSRFPAVAVSLGVAICISAGWGSATILRASDAVNQHGQRELRLDELPAPPPEIRAWLERGQVTFLVGGKRPSVAQPSRSTAAEPRHFAAETRYRATHSFRSRCRWVWRNPSSAQRLAINVRYQKLQLAVSHQVWLEEMPDVETFWESALVLHELDHVRLSSDPRLKAKFLAAVKQRSRIELTREQTLSVLEDAARRSQMIRGRSQPLINRLGSEEAQEFLDEAVDAEFEKIVQLVEIRYRELDRQTDHGRQPIPKESSLQP